MCFFPGSGTFFLVLSPSIQVRESHCQVAALMVVKSPVDVLSNTLQQPGRRGRGVEFGGEEQVPWGDALGCWRFFPDKICSSQKHFPSKKSSDSPQIFLHALNNFQWQNVSTSPHGKFSNFWFLRPKWCKALFSKAVAMKCRSFIFVIITSLEPNPLALMLGRPEETGGISRYEVSNEKRAPGCLGCFKGD